MSDTISLDGTTLNAPDALELAQFYAAITDGVARGNSHWAAVTGPNAFLTFQRVEDFRPPVWPGNDVPMQMHLDFHVDDLEATGKRVLAAGGTLLDFQPNSDHCFVYADPAGHPFCLSTWAGRELADRFGPGDG
ncbi:VOC family protein [Actinopolymorpha sp. NPDC004070]|uniref:VOC family protein n=1 Tax=Actinopolymorpha sp. NPDC004070 TaxID=3154548 RepID=UPI0033BC9E34